MQEIEQNIRQVVQQIRGLTPRFCDVCGTVHTESDFSFVGPQNGLATFQLSCASCGSLDVIQMNPSGAGVSVRRFTSLNTDVKGGEMSKFAGKPQVKRDEALEVYTSLQQVQRVDQLLALVDHK